MTTLRVPNADRIPHHDGGPVWIVRNWLESRMPGTRVELTEFLRAASGSSSEIYFLEPTIHADGASDTMPMVLRIEPKDDGIYQNPSIAREFEVLEALGKSGTVPVPRALWLESDRAVLGAPFMMMERIEGRTPGQMHHSTGLLAESTPVDRAAMWRSAIATMARLHCIDPAAFGFLGSPDTGLEAELARWRTYATWSQIVLDPQMDRALQWLLGNRPAFARGGFAWGDARPENMMFRGTQCVAVIDWETVSLGGAESDLAWWLFYDWMVSDGFGVSRLEGLPGTDETIALWEASTGRRAENMVWHEIFATWRFGLISERSQMLAGMNTADPAQKPWIRRLIDLLDNIGA